MAKKQTGTIAVLLVAVFAVFSAVMFGLNFVTGPIIASNNSSAAYAPLFAVMPEAKDFTQLYAADGSVAGDLANVPETVQAIYQETSGLGYALKMATTKGYTGDAIELTFAVDGEGKVSGIQLDAYPETKDFGPQFPLSFLGQDSTMAGVQLVTGCTYSSAAFRDAVIDGMNALIANELMAAGVKSDLQLLTELVPTAHSGLVNDKGVAQYVEQAGSGNIQTVLKAPNNSGYGLIVTDGDATLLAVINASGSVKVLNTEGTDVTADHASVVAEAQAYAAANPAASTETKDLQRMNMLLPDAAATAIPLGDVFNSVTNAYELKKGGDVYYGLVSRSYNGYNNAVMGVYYVLDQNGTIVGMHADELIFDAEYFHGYTLDLPAYKAGFQGLTAETWTGDQALIAGATNSSNAMKVSTNDIFAAFNAVKGGAEQ